MSLRKITVVSTTKPQPKELYSEATTWRQLQDSLTSDFGNVSSMRAVVKETKNDLSSPDAVLPTGEFTLFLAPKQIKAGLGCDMVSVLQSLKEKWNDAINELIDEIEEGDHAGSVQSAARGTTTVSAEDRDFLNKIANGLI